MIQILKYLALLSIRGVNVIKYIMICRMNRERYSQAHSILSLLGGCIIILQMLATVSCNQLLQCKEILIDNQTVLVHTPRFGLIYVDLHDQGISRAVRRNGGHNNHIIRILLKYVNDNEDILHVGGHIAMQSLAMAKHIVSQNISGTHIHIFEPNPLYYVLSTKTMYLNDLEHIVTVYKVAGYSQHTTGELAVRNTDTAAAQIMPKTSTLRKADYRLQVQMNKVDAILGYSSGNQNKNKIGLAYISANTMEIQVLMGMNQIINQNMDRLVILMDWGFAKNVHKKVDQLIMMLDKWEKHGYKMYEVNIEKQQIQYRQLSKSTELMKIKQGKILFLPKNKGLPLTESKQ